MNTLRLYLPLAGFVVPTVVIGYGFVIPRSCIAGVNELTVGFATTILGAAMTYVAGVKMATPPKVCTKPPISVRVARWINRQAASPRGLFGRFLGWNWRREHAAVNRATLELLDVRPEHRVLEIGSGPGAALRDAARLASRGSALGLDVSPVMVDLARARNGKAVAEGRVDVRQIDGERLDVPEASFDRAYSVHCIYFWRDLPAMLARLASALRPGGKLVLAFRPESSDIPTRFRDPAYRFYRPEEVSAALEHAGLRVLGIERRTSDSPHVVWIVAERS